jgi:uncharacterized protein YdhG (YjbR/CyaY superfamily)
MKRDAETPKAYLATVSGKQLPILQMIRKAIRSSAPDVRESIRYGMLDYPGLANLAAQKQYVALYVAPAVLEAHKRNFPGVDAGRSCLRFRRLDQVDVPALEALLADVRSHRARSAEDD